MITTMKEQTIGVEVEMNGISRRHAAEVAEKAIRTYQGTNPSLPSTVAHLSHYDTYYCLDAQGRKWSFVRDASIVAACDEEKTELNTPVLSYEDIPLLQDVIRALFAAGGRAHTSCGIHVHVGLGEHTPQTIRNLCNLVSSRDDLIQKSLGNEYRRNWCRPINEDFLHDLNQKKPTTWDQLEAIWYTSQGYRVSNHDVHYSDTRYSIVNLHSIFYRKAQGEVPTIEFRAFNSTMHSGKIKAYIQWCLAVSYQALTSRSASAKPVVTDNPAYTFRCWLLRLGLNGDEFKTCRLHLMAYMPGNAAWRNGDPTNRNHG